MIRARLGQRPEHHPRNCAASVPLTGDTLTHAHISDACLRCRRAGKVALSHVDVEPTDPFAPDLLPTLMGTLFATTGRVSAMQSAKEVLVLQVMYFKFHSDSVLHQTSSP